MCHDATCHTNAQRYQPTAMQCMYCRCVSIFAQHHINASTTSFNIPNYVGLKDWIRVWRDFPTCSWWCLTEMFMPFHAKSEKLLYIFPCISRKFWAVCRHQSLGSTLCGSENMPPAIDVVVSQVSCVNSGRPVGGAWSAVLCEIWYVLRRPDVNGLMLRERGCCAVGQYNVLIVNHRLSQCRHPLLGQQHPALCLPARPSELSRSSLYQPHVACFIQQSIRSQSTRHQLHITSVLATLQMVC